MITLRALADRHWLSGLTLIIVVAAWLRLGWTVELPAIWAFIFGGALLATIDVKAARLPSRIIYATGASIMLLLAVASVVTGDWRPLVDALVGGLIYCNAFFLIWLFTEKYARLTVLGLGDVRLAAILGLVLGWYGLEAVVIGAIAGHLLGLATIVGLSLRRGGWQLRVPFGPALIVGTLATIAIVA